MKTFNYHVNCKLRDATPSDFKIKINGFETFRKGVVFFKMNANEEFYGPFVTGDLYDPYYIKKLLDEKNIFVFA